MKFDMLCVSMTTHADLTTCKRSLHQHVLFCLTTYQIFVTDSYYRLFINNMMANLQIIEFVKENIDRSVRAKSPIFIFIFFSKNNNYKYLNNLLYNLS